MSQRLHIGKVEETSKVSYDCVLTDVHNARTKLMDMWLTSPGPLKIRIVDWELWDYVKGIILYLMFWLNKKWPRAIWVFYYKDNEIEHPTLAELEEWEGKMRE